MKQYKGKIIAAAVILGVLAAAFLWGGNYPGRDVSYRADTPASTATAGAPGNSNEPAAPAPGQSPAAESAAPGSDKGRPLTAEEKLALAASLAGDESSPGVEEGSAEYSGQQGMAIDKATGKDKYLTGPVPEGKPVPVEPENAVIKDTAYSCTLSVRCDTILNNIKWLDPEKVELVPEDGVIFPAARVTFYEGESVFNLLLREMKKNKIHMEFENTPIYNSAYIEGINNLYEFDCGELSGWMYKVNGWFPNYGCSRYQLKDGDVVEWVYTCDLGRDVGGYYAIGGQ
ncbi:MAG: hypothetical protein BWY65_01620 [Firmicutes bacterium ADurb.Bin373]|nr:MAG: hypothetical protein BWY65_01620 [Firmicutes bacterium ADurb.Bin373]